LSELKNKSSQVADLYLSMTDWQKEIGDKEGALITLENALKAIPDDAWVKNHLAMEHFYLCVICQFASQFFQFPFQKPSIP
ncbi:MAG: hypothetical protein SFU27_09790, partial [Thermonemataceae bacterium]|nr:hypothetical protein [Thermonemataceae bacterium]